jgi:hypothetical protein
VEEPFLRDLGSEYVRNHGCQRRTHTKYDRNRGSKEDRKQKPTFEKAPT